MIMSANNSYTRKNLMHGEHIVYSARGHFFNYFSSIVAILIGLYLTGIFVPKVPEKLKETESFQEISKNIDNRMKDISYSLDKVEQTAKYAYKDMPEEVKGYMHFLTLIRTTYFGIIFLFLGSVNFIKVYIQSKTNEYCVTNRRVILKYGFFTTDTNEVSLDRIEGVKVKQTMTDKIVGRGNVLINGIGNEQVEMRKISEPSNLRKAVLEAVNRHAVHLARK